MSASHPAGTYLKLVDDAVAASDGQMKRSEAHKTVMAANPTSYREYLRSIGVAR